MYILILCSHLHLDLPSDHFTSDILTKTLNAFIFYAMHTTCHACRMFLDLLTLITVDLIERKIYETLNYIFFPPRCYSLLRYRYVLQHPVSNPLIYVSSLCERKKIGTHI
jgi:hypothetical protein